MLLWFADLVVLRVVRCLGDLCGTCVVVAFCVFGLAVCALVA